MTVSTNWGYIGVAYDGVGLNVFSDPVHGQPALMQVDWGDGQVDQLTADTDTNGDGTPDTVQFGHTYGSDGTYDILASGVESGRPPIHLQAFEYARATNDVVINATSHLDHQFEGGIGNDSATGSTRSDWFDGNAGNDTLVGGGGFDFLIGDAGDDVVKGGSGGDLLTGGDGNDTILGGDDGDSIYGGADNDTLNGQDGNDYIDGETGRDVLIGGTGSDKFVFDSLMTDDKAVDRGIIRDFTQGQDQLWLNTTGSYKYIYDNAFDGLQPEVRSEIRNSNTFVYVDNDGNGKADFFFRLTGQIELSGNDFYNYFGQSGHRPGLDQARPEANAASAALSHGHLTVAALHGVAAHAGAHPMIEHLHAIA